MRFLRRWLRALFDSRPRHRFITIAPESSVRMCIRCDRLERETATAWCDEPLN